MNLLFMFQCLLAILLSGEAFTFTAMSSKQLYRAAHNVKSKLPLSSGLRLFTSSNIVSAKRCGSRQTLKMQKKADQEPRERKKLLVVGLGNPGDKYTWTRHNAGFLAADELARRLGAPLAAKSAFLGEYGSANFAGKSIGILKPKTYMNRSGESIRKVMEYFKIPAQDVLVLVDEVAIDYGTLRLKAKGSPGGHNGLKSCQQMMGTQEYPRLRIGVGGPKSDLVNHVLGEFSRQERNDLDLFISKTAEAAEMWIQEDDIQKVMNHCNAAVNQPLAPPPPTKLKKTQKKEEASAAIKSSSSSNSAN